MKKILSLVVALALAVSAMAYDFSAVTSTGQTVYYTITGSGTVKAVAPAGSSWGSFAKPTGRMTLPATVVNNGVSYSLTAIDTKAFQDCIGLTSVEVPGSVVSVGNRAFARDEALTRAVMAEGVQRIDLEAFKMCTALDTIVLPSTLVRVAAAAFENTAYFNNSANWIGGHTLAIGPWVIKVGNMVEGLVTLPEGTVGIANSALLYCRFLRRVNLPSTLLYVGEGAFKDCEQLDTVRIYAANPPSLYSDSFMGVAMPATLIVPCQRVEAYQAADYWNSFAIEDSCQTAVVEAAATAPISVCMTAEGVVVHGAEGTALAVCDMMGRTVCSVNSAATEQRLPLPAAGIYVLRAGGRAVKISYCCR